VEFGGGGGAWERELYAESEIITSITHRFLIAMVFDDEEYYYG